MTNTHALAVHLAAIVEQHSGYTPTAGDNSGETLVEALERGLEPIITEMDRRNICAVTMALLKSGITASVGMDHKLGFADSVQIDLCEVDFPKVAQILSELESRANYPPITLRERLAGPPTPDPLAGENPGQAATVPAADESATDQLEPVVDIMAALKKALDAIQKKPRKSQEAPDA